MSNYQQHRVWSWIAAQPEPVYRRDIAAALGVENPNTLSDILCKLLRADCIIRTGRTYTRGRNRPVDKRGMARASRANLRLGPLSQRADALPPHKQPAMAQALAALEQAWRARA